MRKTTKDLIVCFLQGETEGHTGSNSNPGNLKIKEDQLIHYSTPILERTKGKYILNMTRYSVPTGRIQKTIQEVLDESLYVIVLKVPMNYKGSLNSFCHE